MKLKSNFLTQTIDDTVFLVPVGNGAFNGMIRGNKTTAFLIGQLKNEISEEELIDATCEQYDAPREVIAADVKKCLATLRSVGALEE
jgi:hypothetical protein